MVAVREMKMTELGREAVTEYVHHGIPEDARMFTGPNYVAAKAQGCSGSRMNLIPAL